MEKGKDFGEGTLFVVSNYIYWFLMTNVYFILCNSLFLFFYLAVQPKLSNLLIYFLALIPTGPAISALFYCLKKLVYEKEISPSRDFFKGYKLNFIDTMRFWLPLLLIFFILIVDLQWFYSKGTLIYVVLSVIFLIGMVLVIAGSLYLFTINASFHFRTRDLYKLSVYYLFKNLKITVGNIGIVVITLFISFMTTNFLLLLLASLVCCLFVLNSKKIIEDVKLNFCEPLN